MNRDLGQVTIERDGQGVVALYPNGKVANYLSHQRMLQAVKRWAEKQTKPGETTTISIVCYGCPQEQNS